MDTRTILMLAVAAVVALAGGFGFAQQEEPPEPMPSTSAPTLEGDIEEQAAQMSGTEKVETAQASIAEMKVLLEQTQELLEKVRKEEQDILKLNCINEKLAATKGFLKVSEQSYVNLKDAVERGDTEAETHHYTLIAIAAQKVDNLAEEAQVCAGEVLRFAEDTVIDRNVDDDIADIEVIDVEDSEFDDGFATERLPELTPFQ